MATYLYNDIPFPDINEVWTDKETYPCALIGTHTGGTIYYLAITTGVPQVDSGGDAYVGAFGVTNSTFVFENGKWCETASTGMLNPLWTSHDLYTTDGTLYLAASEPVPVHVTESKGDGYALYNGVKLPNIDAVWTDKETYTGAIIFNHLSEGITFYSLLLLPDKESFCYENQILVATPYRYYYIEPTETSEWELETDEGETTEWEIRDTDYPLWSNHDILNTTDNSVYLPASDPIPLDGMNVIEWDGNTEGVEKVDTICRLADYQKAKNALLTVRNSAGSYVVADDFEFYEEDDVGPERWSIDLPNGTNVVGAIKSDIDHLSAGIWCEATVGEDVLIVIAYTPATTEPEGPEEPAEPTERSLYSYNGTTFPNINTVWTNKTTYPYAVLFDDGNLMLLTKRPYYNSVKGSYKWPSESFTSSSFRHIGNGWMFTSTNIDVSLPETINMATPLWLNVDLLTETGEVYQATTEPVYIGEADPVPEAESYYLYSHNFFLNAKQEIPALPYWDKEKYPYYLIARSNAFRKSATEKFYEFVLAISTEPFYEKSTYYPVTDVTENQILVPSQNTEVKLCWYRYDYPGFVWSPFILKEPVIENGTWKYTVKFDSDYVLLSNVNILDSNGYIWAGLNQLLPVPTKLENFICGYIAGLSGGHTEFRDNTWPIQFDVNVVLRNKVQLAVKTPKISDIVMSESDIANLKVSVIKQDGMVYELVRDEDSEVVTFDYGYRSTYHSVDKSESVYVFSFHTSGDGDTVLSGPVPETGTYCMCSRDNSIIRIDK